MDKEFTANLAASFKRDDVINIMKLAKLSLETEDCNAGVFNEIGLTEDAADQLYLELQAFIGDDETSSIDQV